jgi:hypothetical protein
MKKIILVLVFFNTIVFGFTGDDDYKVYKSKFYSIIYTDTYKNEAAFIKENLEDFFELNEKLFSYKMDESLKIVLVSNQYEIANAFSTQTPFNMSVFYNAGAHKIDYFSAKSWLTTLLVHELIHNYQINAKKSKVSQVLHKYLGNNDMPIWLGPVPIFTYPNVLLPTFLLEGNATYNESIYNNGGRLLNGRFNALKNLLALDGKINPKRLINDHENFPYGEEKYIVGGFFMDYLVNKFGLQKVNSFFYNNSKQVFIPLFLENSFLAHFGRSLKSMINDFAIKTSLNAKAFKELDGELLASSKGEIYLNKQNDEVAFISANLKTRPFLNIYSLSTKKITTYKSSWKNGKVFNLDGVYYTDSSGLINTEEYRVGLFDENRIIKEGSESKYIQDIKGKDILYIDMKSSFMNNKLYLNEYFYDEVNSSALFDDEKNIYYFKQNGLKRELYKNKKKILEFESYYSKLADIKNGKIYFIASSKLGSSLYMYDKGNVKRVHKADNIIDAKLINDNEIIASVITSSYYKVFKTKLLAQKEKIFEHTSILDKKLNYTFKDTNNTLTSNNTYSEFDELSYTNTYISLGLGGYIHSNFTDPLAFNHFTLGAYMDEELDLSFISYLNQRYYLPIYLSAYVTNREDKHSLDRGYGFVFQSFRDLYISGLNSISSDYTFYLDDQVEKKNPSVLSFNYVYDEFYPLSSDSFRKLELEITAREDRSDFIGQVKSSFTHHLFDETYLDISGFYSKSNNKSFTNERGIKLSDEFTINKDKTVHYVDGFDLDLYVKEVSSFSIGVSKSLDFSKYSYSLPISLIDESVFYKYSFYDLKKYNDAKINVHTLGLKMNILLAHKLKIPFSIRSVKNEYKEGSFLRTKNQVKFELGFSF